MVLRGGGCNPSKVKDPDELDDDGVAYPMPPSKVFDSHYFRLGP